MWSLLGQALVQKPGDHLNFTTGMLFDTAMCTRKISAIQRSFFFSRAMLVVVPKPPPNVSSPGNLDVLLIRSDFDDQGRLVSHRSSPHRVRKALQLLPKRTITAAAPGEDRRRDRETSWFLFMVEVRWEGFVHVMCYCYICDVFV